jgi:hypothetical protein
MGLRSAGLGVFPRRAASTGPGRKAAGLEKRQPLGYGITASPWRKWANSRPRAYTRGYGCVAPDGAQAEQSGREHRGITPPWAGAGGGTCNSLLISHLISQILDLRKAQMVDSIDSIRSMVKHGMGLRDMERV